MLNSVDKEYHRVLRYVFENGRVTNDRTGVGTLSVFGQMMQFDLREGFPVLTTKKLHFRSIATELVWFLRGETNVNFLRKRGVTIWDEWADENGDLGPVYGKQWRDFAGVDQIKKLLKDLKTDPDSRRLLVSAWNPADLPKMKLPPCHYAFQLKTYKLSDEQRNKIFFERFGETVPASKSVLDELKIPTREIHLAFNMRSGDMFLGVPFDIASYALLLEIIAKEVNMVPATLTLFIGDTHIYLNHLSYVKEQLERESAGPPPVLKIAKSRDIFSYEPEDFLLENYVAHPNWKNVPVAV